MDLDDPTTVALLVADALAPTGARVAICGGLLVAAYGEPRETRDADFAVVELTAQDACSSLREKGIETQIAFEGLTFGGLSVDRVTLLGSGEFTGLNTLDLVRPRCRRYAEAALERAVKVPIRDRQVDVLTPEDFLVFKALSTRERDLDDAASAVCRSGAQIDFDLVDREVEALSSELTDHDVRARYAEIRRRAEAS